MTLFEFKIRKRARLKVIGVRGGVGGGVGGDESSRGLWHLGLFVVFLCFPGVMFFFLGMGVFFSNLGGEIEPELLPTHAGRKILRFRNLFRKQITDCST